MKKRPESLPVRTRSDYQTANILHANKVNNLLKISNEQSNLLEKVGKNIVHPSILHKNFLVNSKAKTPNKVTNHSIACGEGQKSGQHHSSYNHRTNPRQKQPSFISLTSYTTDKSAPSSSGISSLQSPSVQLLNDYYVEQNTLLQKTALGAPFKHNDQQNNDSNNLLKQTPEKSNAFLDSYKELIVRLSQAQLTIDELSRQTHLQGDALKNWRPYLRDAIIMQQKQQRAGSSCVMRSPSLYAQSSPYNPKRSSQFSRDKEYSFASLRRQRKQKALYFDDKKNNEPTHCQNLENISGKIRPEKSQSLYNVQAMKFTEAKDINKGSNQGNTENTDKNNLNNIEFNLENSKSETSYDSQQKCRDYLAKSEFTPEENQERKDVQTPKTYLSMNLDAVCNDTSSRKSNFNHVSSNVNPSINECNSENAFKQTSKANHRHLLISYLIRLKWIEDNLTTLQNQFTIDDFLMDAKNSLNANDQKTELNTNIYYGSESSPTKTFMEKWENLKADWHILQQNIQSWLTQNVNNVSDRFPNQTEEFLNNSQFMDQEDDHNSLASLDYSATIDFDEDSHSISSHKAHPLSITSPDIDTSSADITFGPEEDESHLKDNYYDSKFMFKKELNHSLPGTNSYKTNSVIQRRLLQGNHWTYDGQRSQNNPIIDNKLVERFVSTEMCRIDKKFENMESTIACLKKEDQGKPINNKNSCIEKESSSSLETRPNTQLEMASKNIISSYPYIIVDNTRNKSQGTINFAENGGVNVENQVIVCSPAKEIMIQSVDSHTSSVITVVENSHEKSNILEAPILTIEKNFCKIPQYRYNCVQSTQIHLYPNTANNTTINSDALGRKSFQYSVCVTSSSIKHNPVAISKINQTSSQSETQSAYSAKSMQPDPNTNARMPLTNSYEKGPTVSNSLNKIIESTSNALRINVSQPITTYKSCLKVTPDTNLITISSLAEKYGIKRETPNISFKNFVLSPLQHENDEIALKQSENPTLKYFTANTLDTRASQYLRAGQLMKYPSITEKYSTLSSGEARIKNSANMKNSNILNKSFYETNTPSKKPQDIGYGEFQKRQNNDTKDTSCYQANPKSEITSVFSTICSGASNPFIRDMFDEASLHGCSQHSTPAHKYQSSVAHIKFKPIQTQLMVNSHKDNNTARLLSIPSRKVYEKTEDNTVINNREKSNAISYFQDLNSGGDPYLSKDNEVLRHQSNKNLPSLGMMSRSECCAFNSSPLNTSVIQPSSVLGGSPTDQQDVMQYYKSLYYFYYYQYIAAKKYMKHCKSNNSCLNRNGTDQNTTDPLFLNGYIRDSYLEQLRVAIRNLKSYLKELGSATLKKQKSFDNNNKRNTNKTYSTSQHDSFYDWCNETNLKCPLYIKCQHEQPTRSKKRLVPFKIKKSCKDYLNKTLPIQGSYEVSPSKSYDESFNANHTTTSDHMSGFGCKIHSTGKRCHSTIELHHHHHNNDCRECVPNYLKHISDCPSILPCCEPCSCCHQMSSPVKKCHLCVAKSDKTCPTCGKDKKVSENATKENQKKQQRFSMISNANMGKQRSKCHSVDFEEHSTYINHSCLPPDPNFLIPSAQEICSFDTKEIQNMVNPQNKMPKEVDIDKNSDLKRQFSTEVKAKCPMLRCDSLQYTHQGKKKISTNLNTDHNLSPTKIKNFSEYYNQFIYADYPKFKPLRNYTGDLLEKPENLFIKDAITPKHIEKNGVKYIAVESYKSENNRKPKNDQSTTTLFEATKNQNEIDLIEESNSHDAKSKETKKKHIGKINLKHYFKHIFIKSYSIKSSFT